MLELRPNCECCNKDLPPDSGGAMICTFECTFCSDCANTRLKVKGICPNCGGELLARPRRPADKLATYFGLELRPVVKSVKNAKAKGSSRKDKGN